jgi:hypothetical protein
MVNTSLRWRGRCWSGEVASAQLPDTVTSIDGYRQVDVRESLRSALRELTAKQRAVIMLRYFEDRTEAETASIMGCSVGTVKSQAATTGVVATHDSGPSGPTKPTTPLAAGTTSNASGNPSPSPTGSCAEQTVTVPNVVGLTQNQAVWIVQAAGLTAGIHGTAAERVPRGSVIADAVGGINRPRPRTHHHLLRASVAVIRRAADRG